MSIRKTDHKTECLVRAAGGEPVRMFALKKGPSSTIAVSRSANGQYLNIPAKNVRQLDPNMENLLAEAYQTGQSEALNRLWEATEPFDLCIIEDV